MHTPEPEITRLLSLIELDGVPLGTDAVLEAVERPQWEGTRAVRDWRNYVPPSVRGAWLSLPLVTRLCVFETAELVALDEDAGTSMITGGPAPDSRETQVRPLAAPARRNRR